MFIKRMRLITRTCDYWRASNRNGRGFTASSRRINLDQEKKELYQRGEAKNSEILS